MFCFGGRVFTEELSGGKLDEVIEAVHDVRGAGDLDSSKVVSDR